MLGAPQHASVEVLPHAHFFTGPTNTTTKIMPNVMKSCAVRIVSRAGSTLSGGSVRLPAIVTPLCFEPSPAPLKAAMEWLGLPGGALRLPMVPIADDTAARLRDAMVAAGLPVERQVT